MVDKKMETAAAKKRLMNVLSEIEDPEIPAVNIVELGIVRDIQAKESAVLVKITPTYSGCPAMQMIKERIRERLAQEGFTQIEVATVYTPAWTTDWMSDETKEKLRSYGIAPPQKACSAEHLQGGDAAACPYCGSQETELRSSFGSTACKAYYFCRSCLQMFEHFKRI